jgi:uncharacterized protein YcbK (DUF882 family)
MGLVVDRPMLTPHFSQAEMACKCRKPDCTAPAMDMDFMRLLERVRLEWSKPLTITSGARCERMNCLVGGSPTSQHLLGKAADIWLDDSDDIEALALLGEKYGMGGIGRGTFHLLHLDSGPSGRRWTYAQK